MESINVTSSTEQSEREMRILAHEYILKVHPKHGKNGPFPAKGVTIHEMVPVENSNYVTDYKVYFTPVF